MLNFGTMHEPTEADVLRALDEAPFEGWPQDERDLLGLFKLMLERLLVTDGGGGKAH